MNLHGIVSGAIGVVNPFVSATWRMSTGFSTVAMKQTPTYRDVPGTMIQLQPLSGGNLRHMDAQNIQGTLKAVYMNANARGVVRSLARGGDLFVIAGETWLVVAELELWPEWCKVAIQLQGAK